MRKINIYIEGSNYIGSNKMPYFCTLFRFKMDRNIEFSPTKYSLIKWYDLIDNTCFESNI